VSILLAVLLLVTSANSHHMVHGGDERETMSLFHNSKHDKSKMCATLRLYSDSECKGHVVEDVVFSTTSEPGQPCFHSKDMPDTYSLSNMFCTSSSYNQDLWLGTPKCDGTEHEVQKYLPGKCLAGLEFVSCVPGPCPDPE